VIFSDESKFNIFEADGQIWCWRCPGEELYDRNLKKTVKHGGGKVMVWGCITRNGVGCLQCINGIMDSSVYIDILQQSFLPTLSNQKIKKKDIYMQQDSDPKHKSKLTTAWLDRKKIDQLAWDPQSPDMNII
jgi:hypothetical protein